MTEEKASPDAFFASMNSIMQPNKEYWFTDQIDEKAYNPFGINTGLSQHIDSILFANEMNCHWLHISKKMHYDYLFYSIRKMQRKYGKWAKKKAKNEDIEAVAEYYQLNRQKAEQTLRIINDTQLAEIKADMEKGTV